MLLFRTFWNCSVLLLFTKSNPFLDPFLNQLYTEHPRTVTGVVLRKRGAAHKVIVSQLRPHMGSPYGYLGSTAHGFCPNVTFRTYEYDAFE